MTDLEIKKLCADAMELHASPWGENQLEIVTWHGPEGEHPTYHVYDPLHDDSQAMALVKKFDLSITSGSLRNADHWFVQTTGTKEKRTVVGRAYDLNRAICECVSEMQSAKVAA